MGQHAFVSMKPFRTMRTEIPEAQSPLRPLGIAPSSQGYCSGFTEELLCLLNPKPKPLCLSFWYEEQGTAGHRRALYATSEALFRVRIPPCRLRSLIPPIS